MKYVQIFVTGIILFFFCGRERSTLRLPNGIIPRRVTDNSSVREVLFTAIESAFHADKVETFFNLLEDDDRRRLQNQMTDSLLKQWSATSDSFFRYSVNIPDTALLFGGLRKNGVQIFIEQGIVNKPSLLSRWPLNPTKYTTTPRNYLRQNPPDRSQVPKKDEKVAIALIQSTVQFPPLVVSLQYQRQEWRIDIPNRIDASRLVANLRYFISTFSDGSNRKMPSETVLHRLVMALYDMYFVSPDRR